jgi:hypothetical protein
MFEGVRIRPEMITRQEQATLAVWIKEEWALTHDPATAPPGRPLGSAWKTPPAVFELVGIRVRAWLELDDAWQADPRLRGPGQLQLPGEFIVPHRWDPEPGFRHVRVNVLVVKPPKGGNPVVSGREYHVPERAAWSFDPGEMHGTVPTFGGVRMMCMYGFREGL